MSDILVDSNILVYCFDPRDKIKQEQAQSVLGRLLTSDAAVLSVQCLSEFFRTVRWRLQEPLDPHSAFDQVRDYARLCKVFDLTLPVLLFACQASIRHQMSIWDSLIWAVAKLNDVTVILTEDAQHNRMLEGVRYLNPFHPEFDLAQAGVR